MRTQATASLSPPGGKSTLQRQKGPLNWPGGSPSQQGDGTWTWTWTWFTPRSGRHSSPHHLTTSPRNQHKTHGRITQGRASRGGGREGESKKERKREGERNTEREGGRERGGEREMQVLSRGGEDSADTTGRRDPADKTGGGEDRRCPWFPSM